MSRATLRRVLSFGLLAALLVMPWPLDTACAGCAGVLEVEGSTMSLVSPGESFTVVGQGFTEGCDDNGDAGLSCGVQAYERPLQDIELRLVRGTATTSLGTEDARKEGDNYGLVTWTVEIPADAPPGRVTLEAGGASLQLRVAP